ncbi:MAG: sterol desaturase family protein [Bacteroidetes bacterium]|nr:sterol desaturase family protein [Bacteroidota bacterium]MDA1120741.1 sterol desaturase family protein [Bacteroidota bacterium]
MDIGPIVLSIPIFFILIGVELLVHHFTKKKIYRFNDAITNLSCGVTSQITGVFMKIGTLALYQFLYAHFALITIPVNWWTVTLLFITADMLYYWGHRMSHQINLFWGSHVVHHQSEDYNLSVALRQSSFQTLWTFGFYLPLAIIGFNTLTFALVTAFITLYQFWIHTETIGKMGLLELVLNTPSHHRVHHGRDPKYIDRNHAGTFIIWDKMFGTFQKEEETPTYGVTKPIDSWNPVWANFDYYVNLYKQASETPGVMNKIGVIFNKPGWRPESLGGYQPIPHVEKSTYKKYDLLPSGRVNYYVLIQFTGALAITSFYLFTQGNYTLFEKALLSMLTIICVVNCGGLLEKKRWAMPMEMLKLVCIPALYFYFFQTSTLFLTTLGYSIGSAIWLMIINSDITNTNQLNSANTTS